MRRRVVRDQDISETRTIRPQDTALWRGALIEIQRQDAEIHRLRRLLAHYGVDAGPLDARSAEQVTV